LLYFNTGKIAGDQAVWRYGFYGQNKIEIESLSDITSTEYVYIQRPGLYRSPKSNKKMRFLKVSTSGGKEILFPSDSTMSKMFTEQLINSINAQENLVGGEEEKGISTYN
jgi:hypothetical protein